MEDTPDPPRDLIHQPGQYDGSTGEEDVGVCWDLGIETAGVLKGATDNCVREGSVLHAAINHDGDNLSPGEVT